MNDDATLPQTATPDELIHTLIAMRDRAPLALIDAAVAHGVAMLDALRAVIDDMSVDEDADDGIWWLQLHAAMILGRLPTLEAGLLLVQLLRSLDERGDEDMQDWLTGQWPGLFANKPAAVIAALAPLVDDRELDVFSRAEAQCAVLEVARQQGPEALEAAIDRLAARIADDSDDYELRDLMAATLLDFPRQRHRALLEGFATDADDGDQAMADVDGFFDGKAIERAYAANRDNPEWLRHDDPWAFYAPQAVADRQARWAAEARLAARQPARAEFATPVPLGTVVRSLPKLGRNDPCHCGSGKKYKKCCGA